MAAGWVAVVSCVLAVAGCAKGGDAEEEEAMRRATPQRLQPDGSIKLDQAARVAIGLTIEPAGSGALPDVGLRFGVVRSRRSEDTVVVSPVTGRMVGAASVTLGATVTAGQTIATIEPVLGASERVSARVQSAELEGQTAAAQQELSVQVAELARVRELEKDKIVSTAKLQEAEAAVAGTRARLAALKTARGVQGGGAGGPIVLAAPVAGTVVVLDAPLGAMVGPGDVVARILEAGPMWIDVAVSPDEPAGDRYEVDVGATWAPAHLISRGAVVEADGTRSDRLEIEARAGYLLPGATVSVRVAHGGPIGVIVPERALVPAGGVELVYVETSAGVFAPRLVQVAARFGGQVRLSAGLRVGDRVVVTGAMSLRGESLRAELRTAG